MRKTKVGINCAKLSLELREVQIKRSDDLKTCFAQDEVDLFKDDVIIRTLNGLLDLGRRSANTNALR